MGKHGSTPVLGATVGGAVRETVVRRNLAELIALQLEAREAA
jgi:hypothetical protein